MSDLNTDVRYIKGIGEKKAQALNKLGVFSLRDLVSFFPRKYEDRSEIKPISRTEPAGWLDVRNLPVAEHPPVRLEKNGTSARWIPEEPLTCRNMLGGHKCNPGSITILESDENTATDKRISHPYEAHRFTCAPASRNKSKENPDRQDHDQRKRPTNYTL